MSCSNTIEMLSEMLREIQREREHALSIRRPWPLAKTTLFIGFQHFHPAVKTQARFVAGVSQAHLISRVCLPDPPIANILPVLCRILDQNGLAQRLYGLVLEAFDCFLAGQNSSE